ncbi:MAG: tol-pal system-associated acyl-CoA thioesterase [Tibeticola sp.]
MNPHPVPDDAALAAEVPAAAEFFWPVRIYWEDTDAGGIVFYANYLKFFERARTEWLRARGIHQQDLRDRAGGQFVVSEVRLRYERPARLDDVLQVSARLVEAGRASFTLEQRALRPDAAGGSTLCCAATVRVGWVDAHSLRPKRLPEEVLQRISL